MSYTLSKNLHLCFSIIKQKSPHQLITNSPNHHHHHSPLPPPTTTTATVFAKNYNSLFEDITSLDPTTTTTTTTSVLSVSDTETDYDSSLDEAGPGTPDLAAAYASRRFFISSPGRSNSIVDSPVDDHHPAEVAAVGVAVETYSPDPYLDFRRSMQEMLAARGVARGDVGGAWEYLQELLLSYLTLNPKSTHKYIVRAFADVVVSSMTSSPINITSSSQCFSADYCSGVTNCSHRNSAYVEIFNNAA